MEVKSLAEAPGIMGGVPLEVDEGAIALRERARAFAEDVLMPLEEEAERRAGRLPDELVARVKREAIDAGLSGGLHAREHGGQGWTRLEWALVEEQYGRTTNAIHWHVPNAYNVWVHASPEQIDRYLRPALRGELKDAYAVTEREAGSDP
ncbi:MAG TPA: acyl-CoA dehydrogenase family protein, partial [Solirubrobacterales bacterium]|nr:acyl-CoA dehydrogenase family protein [Solirubrobacterales bacterium]